MSKMRDNTWDAPFTDPDNLEQIFVFGSNLAGIHGAGSAKAAYDLWGAVWGVGVGLQGRSYAIPTKDCSIQTLSLGVISKYIDQFLDFADMMTDIFTFNVVKIGCGLAGYTEEQIIPMFRGASVNVYLPDGWAS